MLAIQEKAVTDVVFRFDQMSEADTEEVVRLFNDFPEVQFCEWENETLLRDILSVDSSVCYVARGMHANENIIVGALIGGVMGVRSTINHLAVHPSYRRMGVARSLVEHAFTDFRRRGIQRVFLFIVAEATGAHSFWTNLGFRPVENETTCEIDLDSPFVGY